MAKLETALRETDEEATGPNTSSPSPLQYTQAAKALIDDARKRREAKERAEKRGQSLPARTGLPPEVKARMIELFAHFQGVSQVGDAIKREFGLVIDRRTIESFNPDSPRARIGKRLRTMFASHRDAYIAAVAKQGVAHQAHRLRLIGDIVEKANSSKDFNAALRGLELAAKEVGALNSTMTMKHEGTVAHVHASLEDAKAELAMRLQGLIDNHKGEGDITPVVPTVDSVATPVPSAAPPAPLPSTTP